MTEEFTLDNLTHYDYKPLLIQIFDLKSNHMKNLLIDGTTFESCIGLANDNRKKLGGGYFEISCRQTDKILFSSKLNKK